MELQTSLLRGQDYLIYKGPYPHKFSPREKCYPTATQAIHLNRSRITQNHSVPSNEIISCHLT
ncbi:hypothetical protein DPMN_003740 [Dreissena polymorpha]|uniref:Uncharacterized protein n=1 Tax=Dreissena polymorpha TaxID=45954 RepID=A0A9D4MNW0_DREPO|nr:hypothetical protein DPMN_003740 [Dreissena polymorpha]